MDLVINDFISIPATHPVSKINNWHTDVVKFDSGKEQRNQIRESPTRIWQIGWGIMTETQRNEAMEVYDRAKGRYNTFQFRDPQEEIGSSTETAVAYTADSADNTSKTFIIIGDIPEIFMDGIRFEITAGVNDGDWVCDGNSISDGTNTTVTVTAAPTTTGVNATILIQDYQLNTTYYSGESEAWIEDRNEIQHFSIIAVSTANETFKIAGSHLEQLESGTLFIVTDSTGNDKNWVVDTVERSGTGTLITVTGNITNAIVDGVIIILNVISNSVEQVPGTDYEVDEHTGIVQFLANQSPTNTHVVTATYKYNFRVRFNSDFQAMTEFVYGKWELAEIELVEVKL